MVRLKQHTNDPSLLRLINRYLKAGVSVDGNIQTTTQGGPLSPVLANVVLDELDWELERRGHRFARYADDCNIMVKSKHAGERVMASVTRFVSDTLRLTVNSLKSAVDRPAKAHMARGVCPKLRRYRWFFRRGYSAVWVCHPSQDDRNLFIEPPCTVPYARWCGRGRS